MTKRDLIEKLAARADVTRRQAEEVVNLIFDEMVAVLARQGRVEIRGLGSFMVKDYRGYRGRNPRTGESITISAKRLPFFKVGKELKALVDGRGDPRLGEATESSED